MRIIYFLLFSILLQPCLLAQDLEEDKLFQEIIRQKQSIRLKQTEIALKDKTIKDLEISLQNTKHKDDKTEVLYLQRRISDISMEKQKLYYNYEKLKGDLQQILDNNCDRIKTPKLKELCNNTQDELYDNRYIFEGKEGEIYSKENTIEQLMFLNSYISKFEIGVKTKKGTRIIKEYNNDKIIYKKPFLKQLNVVYTYGKIYAYKNHPISQKGKLLIYANNSLITAISVHLEDKHVGELIEYELKLKSKSLQTNIPANNEINVGYIDTKTYINNRSSFKNFWDAQSSGKLLMSNIRPSLSMSNMVDDVLSNCKNKDTIQTESEYIYVSIKDNAAADGDIAAIFFNDREIFKEKLTNRFTEKKQLYLNSGYNDIKLFAVDEGTSKLGC